MKIIILSAVHGLDGPRQHIYEFFLRRMSHIKDKFGTETLVVGSEGDLSREMTERAGVRYMEYENKPVSNKWNAGMEAIREYSPDYVMILGSDDLVSDGVIERYLKIADEGHAMFGLNDLYFWSLAPRAAMFGVCGYWPGYPGKSIMGCGRCFSKGVLDKVGWRPWVDGKNAGIDFSVRKILNKNNVPTRAYKISLKEEGLFCIDIKTWKNISSMSPLKRRMEVLSPRDLLPAHLPQDECEHIFRYADAVQLRYDEIKAKGFRK